MRRFGSLDLPEQNSTYNRRAVSVTPIQALTLMDLEFLSQHTLAGLAHSLLNLIEVKPISTTVNSPGGKDEKTPYTID